MHINAIPDHIAQACSDLTPVLIAGPTASGKSELALRIAETCGGVIINADALQVYTCWNVLTARPPADDLARAQHRLYGHVAHDQTYSVGTWLTEVKQASQINVRPIVVGGTGLYFRALTEGLAEIPSIPDSTRTMVWKMIEGDGLESAVSQLATDDAASIDTNNPARVARALEVFLSTGQSLKTWHKKTPPPLMPLKDVKAFCFDVETDWLNTRIKKRFDIMMELGALQEVEQNLEIWNETAPAFQAIGAPELRKYLQGDLDLDKARDLAVISTHQYAKRQRTWFRKRMQNWYKVQISP